MSRLRQTLEGLLEAERDRRVAQYRQRGEKVYRWGYTGRKCSQTLWGARAGAHPPLAGQQEMGLPGEIPAPWAAGSFICPGHGWAEPAQGVGWSAALLGGGGTHSPATIGAVLRQAKQQIQQRRTGPLSPSTYCALAVDGIHLPYRRRVDRQGRKGVLLVAVGVKDSGHFEVLDWQAAVEETTDAYEALFTRLWRRGLEKVELIVSDGAEVVTSAAAIVYPQAAHQLCLLHWLWTLEELTPSLSKPQPRRFRREFWWVFEADNEEQLRKWSASFCRRWRFHATGMVAKFRAESMSTSTDSSVTPPEIEEETPNSDRERGRLAAMGSVVSPSR